MTIIALVLIEMCLDELNIIFRNVVFVLIDRKGNYIWQGRSNNIPPQIINSAING